MNPHAQALGRLGGKANTPAQNAARARNAKLGGRPKKQKRRKPNAPRHFPARSDGKMHAVVGASGSPNPGQKTR